MNLPIGKEERNNMDNFMQKVQEFLNRIMATIGSTPDTTASYDSADINANKWQGFLAYLGPFCLVPILINLFGSKKSAYGMYHANQGLNLFIVDVAAKLILAGVLGKIPLIGWIFRIANLLIIIASCFLTLMGVMNVTNGRAKELPFIGKIKLIK